MSPSSLCCSPYVDRTGTTNYGSGFGYNTGTFAVTEAAATTLVNSPIANVCASCHDTQRATAHMASNGGSLWQPRSTAMATPEQCLACHGPGWITAIQDVRYGL